MRTGPLHWVVLGGKSCATDLPDEHVLEAVPFPAITFPVRFSLAVFQSGTHTDASRCAVAITFRGWYHKACLLVQGKGDRRRKRERERCRGNF